jgi:hypothetical protein
MSRWLGCISQLAAGLPGVAAAHEQAQIGTALIAMAMMRERGYLWPENG